MEEKGKTLTDETGSEISRVGPSGKFSYDEFKQKYGDILKVNIFKDGNSSSDWIYVNSYDPKTGEAIIFDSGYENGRREKPIKLDKLDEFVETYKPKIDELKIDEPKIEKEDEIIELTDLVEMGETPELKKIRQEIERTRGDYARKDYELSNAITRLKGFLGVGMKTTSKDVADESYLYKEYKNSLNNYLDAKIEALKSSKMDPSDLKREMGELIIYFNNVEKTNLYEARTNARTEARKDQWSHKLWEKSSQIVNWYRKLPLKYKLAFSGVLLAGGVGAGFAATAGISGAAGLMAFISAGKIGQRIMGGAAGGAGAVAIQEGFRRKLDSRKSKKEKEEMLKDFEDIDVNERFEAIMEKLRSEVDTYKQSLEREKRKALNRRFIGAGFGIAVGSGAVSYLTKTGFGHYFGSAEVPAGSVEEKIPTENFDYDNPKPNQENMIPDIAETSPENIPAPEVPPVAEVPSAEEAPSAAEVPFAEEAPSAEEVPIEKFTEISKNIDLTVEKGRGGSFQGSIIKYLESHGVEKGTGKGQSGWLAHRMYLDFIKDHPDLTKKGFNLVHPGACIELSPDGKSVIGFQDSAPGSEWIGDQKIATSDITEEPKAVDTIDKTAETLKPENAVDKAAEELKAEDAAGKIAEDFEANKTEDATGKIVEELKTEDAAVKIAEELKTEDLSVESLSGKEVIGGAVAVGAGTIGTKKLAEIKKAKVIDLMKYGEFKKLAKKYEFDKKDSFFSRAKKTIKKISLGSLENWSIMKNVEFESLKRKDNPLSPKLAKNIENLEKDFIALLGIGAKHKKGETVRQWLARNVDASIAAEKVEQKMAA